MTKRIQAKDIPEKALIDLIDRLYNIPRLSGYVGEIRVTYSAGAYLSDILKFWDNIPPKVILAKLRKLEERGKIDGCACGCIGNFTVVHEDEMITEHYFEEATREWKTRQLTRMGNRIRGQHG